MRSLPDFMALRRLAAVVACLVLTGAVSHAALSRYVAPERLAASAPIVVEATVESVRSGFDPETHRLATYVALDVDRVWRGPADTGRLVLREAGGRWGDLVHEIDAVPRYREGERVVAFLEAAPDGALRTSGMFFGLFRREADADGVPRLVRELDGQGLMLGAPHAHDIERLALDGLRRMVRTTRVESVATTGGGVNHLGRSTRAAVAPTWLATPPEHDRLLWDDRVHAADARPKFMSLAEGQPTRWAQVDVGESITVHVRPDGNPLGDDALAVEQIARGIDAWNDVIESRVRLELGDTDFRFVELYATSPVAAYSGVNIVLFDDPYEDIADPVGCSGVLAVGGYWRASGTGSQVNGIDFHTALQMYVVFNDGFECFLGDPENLAEIAAHEIGHGLGFGHSPSDDALMRAAAYGGRGPRLGGDDVDAAHCHYPHAVTITAPNGGGDAPAAGAPLALRWTPTVDGPEAAGSVDVDYSLDDGASWIGIASATPNDGAYDWAVPADARGVLRLRVSRSMLRGDAPAGYPDRCTVGRSAAFDLGPDERTSADVAATRDSARINPRRPSPRGRDTARAAGRARSSSP